MCLHGTWHPQGMNTLKVRLRPVAEPDRPAVLALNHTEVEMLAPMDAARFDQLRGLAHRFDVIEVEVDGDTEFGGFVITFAPGSAYDSENYAWFSRVYESFYYLDRIVLHPHVRRRGVGRVVYDELEAIATAYDRMTLEVNLAPPNPVSLAFHAAREYVEVGRLGDEDHLVSLQMKELSAER